MKKLLIILFSLLFIYLLIPVNITTKNKVEYKEKYNKYNFKATRLGHNYTKNTKVTGKVNTKTIGEYNLTYKTKIGIITFYTNKKIKVIDSKKPKIYLKGKKITYVCPNKKYKEQGAIALDNYDKDITNKIKIKKQINKITYTVKDSSNNKQTKTRTLIYKDSKKPKINLNDFPEIYLQINDKYKEKVSASDNCDGNITKNIKIIGKVNTKKEGKYKLKYIITDNSNNKRVKEKIINVVSKDKPAGKGINGTIYLTFDDGPSKYTNQILDILKEENIKATFFVTGYGKDELIKREYEEGHSIGLHTYSHNYQTVYSSLDSYFDDLKKVENRVKNITGVESKIIRFPGGSSNTVSKKYTIGLMSNLTKKVEKQGYKYFDWTIVSGDAGETRKSEEVYNYVINGLTKNDYNIVLMHDTNPWTTNALKNIIKFAKENGYTFDKITNNTKSYHQKINN